ncbi:MAG: 3'-5' exonuclease [Steroidobacteraceae bacterium]
MNVLTFDIETVPDVEHGRRFLGLGDLDDVAVAKAMQALARQRRGEDFLPLQQHRIVAIACALRRGENLTVWSLGETDSSEAQLVQRFFDGLERYCPDLVSWNGGGFDLPVLHYRALRNGVVAARYWETGDEDKSFRYNNYLGRFHWRHIDLMDVLSGYQARARASLDEIATLVGLPGKLGMTGADVWPRYLAGDLRAIRQYCETDVLNTYLVYLHFERMRGRLTPAQHGQEIERARQFLQASDGPHWQEYLAAWDSTN